MATTPRSRIHSRRGSSSLNFTNMSLFPLTSSTVLDLEEHSFPRHPDRHLTKSPGPKRNGSYIQHTSAPSTPGILSGSPNPSTYFTPVSPSSYSTHRSGCSTPRTARSRRNSNHNSAGAQHWNYMSDLQQSKSTTQLYGAPNASNAWMHRTGAALSSETREFKGQSWLVSRASSTSLVDDGRLDGEGDWRDWRDWRPEGIRGRSGNAFSMVGSTSRGASRDPTAQSGYASKDEDEAGGLQEETDDEEYLYREKGYGLGMWVDRIIGWSLFSVDDDEGEEEYWKDPYGEGRKKQQPPPPLAPVANTTAVTPESTRQPAEDEAWGDPSWAFSIATQVLF